MIGEILGAAASIAGIAAESAGQGAATNLGYANLQFQKENARRQYRLATAARTDAYGNKLSFDDLLNEWITTLTPQQQAIIKAGEREQYASLTEDTKRARDLRRRQEARSKVAEEDFNRARSDYLYKPPQSEGASEAEGIADAIMARSGRTGEAGSQLARLALRTGRGATGLQEAMDAIARSRAGSLGEDIVRGKEAGRSRYKQDVAAHEGQYRPRLDQLTRLMDDIGGAEPRFSNTPTEMDQKQREMISAISNALGNEASQVGGAYGDLEQIAMKVPNFSSLVSALSGIGDGGMGGKDTTPSFSAPIVDPYSSGGSYSIANRTASPTTMYPTSRTKDDYVGGNPWLVWR